MKSVILRIEFIVGNDIRTRTRIQLIRAQILDAHHYILDFQNVRFISRSFADELIGFIDSYNGTISCVNLNRELTNMLRIVRENRNTPRKHVIKSDVVQLQTIEQVEMFFESV